jgi:NAD(P)-dependent dehydrogenase (short-subunit alcohol dehydrogenase family)
MNKTVLITGVTGALGKATAMELARNNCHVILLARNAEKVAAVVSEIISATGNRHVEFVIADLSEPTSVRHAVQEIRKQHTALNALVNVAAIFKKQGAFNSLGLGYMYATNHLGPFVLTNEVLDLLKAGKGRVITVSAPSTTKIRFEDLQSDGKVSGNSLGAFGASKMMNLMFTYALARRLGDSGVTATVFHPGLVKSKLMKDMPAFLNLVIQLLASKPGKAAKMLTRLAIDDEVTTLNGRFIKRSGKDIKSSKYSHDVELQEKLWKISESLSGMKESGSQIR